MKHFSSKLGAPKLDAKKLTLSIGDLLLDLGICAGSVNELAYLAPDLQFIKRSTLEKKKSN